MVIVRFFTQSLSRKILGIVLVIFLLCSVTGLLIWGLDPYHCRMADGVYIGSLEVSGMSRPEARNALQTSLEESLYRSPLQVVLPEETITLTPEQTTPSVDIRGAVRAAYAWGRKDGQTSRKIDLLPFLEVNDSAIRETLAQYARQYNTTLTEPSWQLVGETPALSTDVFRADAPCQILEITMGYPQSDLDVDAAYDLILEALANAPQLCAENRYVAQIPVIPTSVPQLPDVQAIYDSVCTEPVNDSLDLEQYIFVHGSYGYNFDLSRMQNLIKTADYGQTLSMQLAYVTPEILGDQVYFRDVLGSCDTKHNTNENRNTNLRLLCAAMDGFILQPGETFSYNAVVGERTREKGYLPAPAFSGDRLVDSVGGGVCQGSTTLYNCVLLADLEVIFRACHGATVSYVPLGLDAAVNWGTTDFSFRNSFHFPVQIRAEVSDGYVRMQILGTDEKNYYIKMETTRGEDDVAIYARSFKCRYDKETDELISRTPETYSTYYKNIG